MTSIDYFVPDAEGALSSRGIAAYLEAYTPPNGLVTDPFCQSPSIAQAALHAGRRAIATNASPLDALRTRQALAPTPGRELVTALSRLSDSPKSGMSLHEHLSRLYRLTCPSCSQPGHADYFVWERDQGAPRQVSYRCPSCAQSGLRDCSEDDARVLREVEPRGLHYWYILDRIAKHEDRGRRLAEKLLDLYSPRNLYVLSNLVLKIDDLFAGTVMHDFMRQALLHCLESGSRLNPVPGEPALGHAAGLTPPPRFVERNVWQLFIDTISQYAKARAGPSALAASLREVASPAAANESGAPVQGRAFVGHMSVRQLAQEMPAASVDLVLAQPPLLGRTRWALPFLWTGWLYGHQAAASLWPLIRRRASDWPFYLRAMQATLLALQKTLKPDGRIVFVGQSTGLAFNEALTLAAAGANMRLQSAVYHARELEAATKPYAGLCGDYRLTWAKGPPVSPWPMGPKELATNISQLAAAAAEEALEQRGEPAPFARLHCAVWEALAQRNLLQRVMSTPECREQPNGVREQVKAALESEIGRTFVQLWRDEEKDECLWWLVNASSSAPPLSERVELAVRDALAPAETIETTALLAAIYSRFPRGLTPDAEWVMACVTSYGEAAAPEQWVVRAGDRPGHRARARATTIEMLRGLGLRAGCEVRLATDGLDVLWIRGPSEASAFIVLDSLALSRALNWRPEGALAAAARYVVFPEERHSLMHLKLARFAWLKGQLSSKGWQFLKDSELPDWAHRAPQDSGQLSLM